MPEENKQREAANQAYFGNTGKDAGDIDVTLFREIIFVPLTIDAKDEADPRFMTGRQRMEEVSKILERDSGGSWKREGDRLRHLPEDRSEDLDSSGKPSVGVRAELLNLKRQRGQYEEYVYFEPYVQRFLYRTTPRSRHTRSFPPLIDKRRSDREGGGAHQDAGPIALFVREDIKNITVTYKRHEAGPEHPSPAPLLRRYSFKIERCNLYLYETGNAVLVLELLLEHAQGEGEATPASGSPSEDVQQITLGDCQTVIENLRRVFPPYFTEEGGRVGDPEATLEAAYYAQEFSWKRSHLGVEQPEHMPVDPKEQIDSVIGDAAGRAPRMFSPWRRILEPVEIEGSREGCKRHRVRFGQTGDDRGFVMAQIGVPSSFDIRRSDWVRLCFCDAPGSGYSYSQHFLSDFEESHCYDRFFDYILKNDFKSLRYLVCPYAFVMVGSCRDDIEDYFYHLFSRHFRRAYFQLVLISVYQKVALLSLSERLAEAIDSGSFEERSEAIHEEILLFTHRYWFEDISAQIQGHELFSKLRRHMRTDKLYRQLSQEVRETTDRLAVVRQDRLNRLVGVGLVLATFVGFFGMNVFAEGTARLGPVSWPLFLGSLALISAFFAVIYLFGQKIGGELCLAVHGLRIGWRKMTGWTRRRSSSAAATGNVRDREADPPAHSGRRPG